MPPRKPLSECTPEEAEARREYMRKKQAESRARKKAAGIPPPADNRDRNDYMREYMRKKRTK